MACMHVPDASRMCTQVAANLCAGCPLRVKSKGMGEVRELQDTEACTVQAMHVISEWK
jgi:hypothetical protein